MGPQVGQVGPRFKAQNTYETRKEVAAQLREQYPNRLPVIVELDPKAQTIIGIIKKQWLAPPEATLDYFALQTRHVIQIGRQELLAFMVESGDLIMGTDNMESIYKRFRDPDGFLYLNFTADVAGARILKPKARG